jgi:hypothetical protein
MGFTTFSGPVRSGTKRHGAAGTRNTGLVVLSQEWDSGDLTGKTQTNYDQKVGLLPQGARIVDIVVDQVVAAGTGTTTVSVGSTSGGAELMAAVDSSTGGRFRGTANATTQLAWLTSTSADTSVYVRYAVGTGTLSAGRFVVTVMYVQRAPDGAIAPTYSQV